MRNSVFIVMNPAVYQEHRYITGQTRLHYSSGAFDLKITSFMKQRSARTDPADANGEQDVTPHLRLAGYQQHCLLLTRTTPAHEMPHFPVQQMHFPLFQEK